MKVTELITRAYYASQVISPEFESITNQRTSDALFLLNMILGDSQVDVNFTPFEETRGVVVSAGSPNTFVSNLIQIRQMQFLNDPDGETQSILYGCIEDTQMGFYGSTRPLYISTLPFHYYPYRQDDGMMIEFMYQPSQDTEFIITGKWGLKPLLISDNLDQFETYFINYLIFLLAESLCNYNTQAVPSYVAQQISKYERLLREMSPLHLDGVAPSAFQIGYGQDPFWFSLFKGYIP